MSNRSILLEEALRLFAERGYDAVGVQEVCAAAGVTKPTLYHYFGSKRGLLETLVRERFQPFLEALRREAEFAGDLPDTLERVTTTYFRFASDDPALWRLLLALWLTSRSSEAATVIAPFRDEEHRVLVALFVHATGDADPGRTRPRTYAMTLLGTIHGYIGLSLDGVMALDDAAARDAVHQFAHGILG